MCVKNYRYGKTRNFHRIYNTPSRIRTEQNYFCINRIVNCTLTPLSLTGTSDQFSWEAREKDVYAVMPACTGFLGCVCTRVRMGGWVGGYVCYLKIIQETKSGEIYVICI